MPEKDRHYSPTRSFDLQVKIKDLDYTEDITGVSIQSSLSTAYQVVTLDMLIDPNDVLLNDFFGKEPIKLFVRLLSYGNANNPSDQLEFELMYLKSEFNITERSTLSEGVMNERTAVRVTTITRQPFKTMTSIVNGVYIGKTLNDVISDLVNQIGSGPKLEFDSDGRNNEVIDQVCVPPITLYNAIKECNRRGTMTFDGYLDQRFGLFEGTPGVFCQHDNVIQIKNLTKKLTKNQTFTIYQFGDKGEKKTLDIIEESQDGKTFYTYQRIFTDYSANAKFAALASTLYHIVKPKDQLAAIVQQDLKTVAQDYSLTFQNKTIDIDIDAVTRIKFYNEDTGYEDSATLFNSRFGRTMADLSTISIQLEKDLPVLNLINVGEAVKFKPQTIEYASLGGKYILWSSVLNFGRRGDWSCVANINLIRTNKKI
jgi:LysM repeat protein